MAEEAGGATEALGGGEAGGGTEPVPWTNGVDEAGIGFIENKGWKGPGDMLASYQSLEKMTGAPPEQLVRLPGDPEDADAWGEVYAKLGRPASGEGYDFEGIENPEGTVDLMPVFREWALKYGLNQKQARGLVETFNGHMQSLIAEAEGQTDEQTEADIQALRGAWGATFDENIQAGRRMVQRFGIDADTLGKLEAALGTRGLLELTAKIGRGLGEHRLPREQEGVGGEFGMTPQAAQAQINELKLNKEFMDAYLSGNAEAKGRMTRLMRLAHPEPA